MWSKESRERIHRASIDSMLWSYKNGVLCAENVVSRKYFGNFAIYFEQNPSKGTVVVWIENKDFPVFNRTKIGYENFEKAVEAVMAFFDNIAEKQKNITPAAEYRASQAYKKVIADEIAKML